MPDAFTDLVRVTRSHIPVANMPAKMDVPNVGRIGLLEARDTNLGDPRTLTASQSSASTQKHGKLLGWIHTPGRGKPWHKVLKNLR
ncbi:hypothetical protein ACFX15_043697 [Malus domestica]